MDTPSPHEATLPHLFNVFFAYPRCRISRVTTSSLAWPQLRYAMSLFQPVGSKIFKSVSSTARGDLVMPNHDAGGGELGTRLGAIKGYVDLPEWLMLAIGGFVAFLLVFLAVFSEEVITSLLPVF